MQGRAEALRGVLNAGYRQGGVVSVCIGKGSEQSVADFATFCPKALAGIGHLPDTIASRCVPIVMRRKAPYECAERLRMRDARALAEPLRERLVGAAERLLDQGLRMLGRRFRRCCQSA